MVCSLHSLICHSLALVLSWPVVGRRRVLAAPSLEVGGSLEPATFVGRQLVPYVLQERLRLARIGKKPAGGAAETTLALAPSQQRWFEALAKEDLQVQAHGRDAPSTATTGRRSADSESTPMARQSVGDAMAKFGFAAVQPKAPPAGAYPGVRVPDAVTIARARAVTQRMAETNQAGQLLVGNERAGRLLGAAAAQREPEARAQAAVQRPASETVQQAAVPARDVITGHPSPLAGASLQPLEIGLVETALQQLADAESNRQHAVGARKQFKELCLKLQAGEVKATTAQALLRMASAVKAKDLQAARREQMDIVRADWEQCRAWLQYTRRALS